jgi:hypothetical protein
VPCQVGGGRTVQKSGERWVNGVQHGARPGKSLGPFTNNPPRSAVHVLTASDERVELPLGFQLDFQLGHVEIFGIIQLAKHNRVDELRDTLSDPAGVLFLGDVKENDFRREARGDEVKQIGHLGRIDLLLEEIGEWMSAHRCVLEGIAEVLGEGTLTRTEEARDPHTDALVWLGRCFGDRLQQHGVLIADAVGRDVFGDLRIDRLFVGLVDLDDLLDLPGQVSG